MFNVEIKREREKILGATLEVYISFSELLLSYAFIPPGYLVIFTHSTSWLGLPLNQHILPTSNILIPDL